MTARAYLLRSLAHHRFAYLGVFLGAVLGATVLLGALFAGDSVQASLRRIAEHRIGQATHLVSAGDRFFREDLAADFARASGTKTAPVLYARGAATHAGTQAFANRIQLVGVTPAFWSFAPVPHTLALPTPSSAAINTTLAHRLGLKVGDTVIVRVQKPGILAGNAPVAGAEAKLQSLRCTVAAIVDDDAFGRFTLETTQVAQPSLFLPLATLQEAFGRDARANLLLVAAPNSHLSTLNSQLLSSLQLADYGLKLRHLPAPASVFEVTSDRLFLDPAQLAALTAAAPAAQPVVAYLVNDLRIRDSSTPYSVAAATTPTAAPFLPADLGPRDIVLNRWLADDLQARIGDELRLAYFQVGPRDDLVERTATFRVHTIIPLEGLAAETAWMPEFPGITDVHDQSKWDPGLPLDLKRIRDKDERYWDDYRGAPKAWLSLAAGRELWSTRWGHTTALRLPAPGSGSGSEISDFKSQISNLESQLLRALRPEMNQLQLRDLRAGATAAAASSVDFAGLFIGMSFFLILAALGLVAMLFQFVLLQRNQEDALLTAVGIAPRTLLRWRLLEGLVLLTLAALVALPLAALYTQGILRFLETIWSAQSAGSTFVFHASPASIAGGIVGFLLLSLAAIWLAIRKLALRSLSIRLAAKTEDTAPLPRVRRTSLLVGLAALAAAILALGFANRGLPAQIAFYLAGFALLAAGLAAFRWWAALPPVAHGSPSPTQLGVLNLRARRSRSLTVVGLIATAVFMVLSVASFRKHVGADWLERGSGTGGFAFWIETTAPQNFARETTRTGFDFLSRHASALGDIVPLRAGAGDNANCFNLNSTAQPQLLTVPTARLAARGAFRLNAPVPPSAIPNPQSSASPWSLLTAPSEPDVLPAFVDQNTLLWALKRKVGDTLDYTDEAGRPFRIRIVGTLPDSLFQGYALVDEQRFLEKFPSHPGYSIFLADLPPSSASPPSHKSSASSPTSLRGQLETSARDVGGRVELTRDILAAFHRIENTYIAIFNVLGSLGVVLGSLGLAIVVARNLRERRGEFAVMSALGIPRPVLARLVFAEFSRLVLWGLAIGTLASLVAILPSLTVLPPATTAGTALALLLGILALNFLSGLAIFRRALRDLHPSAALATS